MGMASMFDLKADLSGLLDSLEELFVDEVYHKTIIEINERYTEAAGVTGEIWIRFNLNLFAFW